MRQIDQVLIVDAGGVVDDQSNTQALPALEGGFMEQLRAGLDRRLRAGGACDY